MNGNTKTLSSAASKPYSAGGSTNGFPRVRCNCLVPLADLDFVYVRFLREPEPDPVPPSLSYPPSSTESPSGDRAI
ncbi:hypothetical protein MSAN_02528600 [Mycena sanguinolenta]|uniref:Uncharacterized protein n=1 Tax=Mycena sanguinolenta TaxID=230812 RepID=A0A8H6TV19_9AGAR|nr:hypothetical protein MSAN_02528600 [Mycena sanguinolenta]